MQPRMRWRVFPSMVQVNIKNKAHPFPEGWQDCTIEQLIKCEDARASSVNPLAKAITMLSALSNIPEKEIRRASEDEMIDMLDRLEFTKALPEVKADKRSIEINGRSYTPPKDIGKATFGQYADFEIIVARNLENPWGAVPFVLAIYLDEEGAEYDSDHMLERAELFKQVSAIEAVQVAAFFLTSAEHCRMLSEACTIQIAAAMASHLTLLNGHKTTRGFQRFISWPRVILSKCLWWNTRNAGASFISSTSRAKNRRPGKRMLKFKN